MPLFGPGYSGPSETKYLFVDGGALHGKLRHVSEKYFNRERFNIDFEKLSRGFTKTFYYDAIPVRLDEEEGAYKAKISEQVALHDAASAVRGVHVYEGDARFRRGKGGLQQKKVDVMLTVDLLMHTFRRNMHKATLLTGDADFTPLVDAVVREGMFVSLWYPLGETSNELIRSADNATHIGMSSLKTLLTEESLLRFNIPTMQNKHPSIYPDGILMNKWISEGKNLELWKTLEGYALLIEGNNLNRLWVEHEDITLLRDFASEDGISIPAEING